ncbi:Protein N-acetyltransferase, RimJ/RimL family [Streptoalloteichus tenebrarius]|uniref:Protein N-acetyltransferase, RimJ/RimL family n=1 Tax=Streptoalloteichus tenebrarius (strain ATCC 17920 / DSM 40477 / JCM 4838 / CBS 697.72 / NBRC 16177 / NCIMB 11028 / NRRL B-12390 / A12253. 1 / ISP 5477) TaxID=1933 RepID=A0ABT1I1J6_STRSD|nr:Protein N-acetyltransferase, RimJ/RimL family [Streptoalloteichus tenebrarius]
MEPEDADTFWRWNNDPDVVHWLQADYPESLAATRRRFADLKPNSYSHALFAIETITGGKLIGCTTLRDATPETARAELDIYIGEKDQWGSGYGTDALRTVCRYGFDAMRLHSIALWVVAENEAAIHVYQKVGFRVDGRHRDAHRGVGRWHDLILMSLLEGELT